MKIYIYAIAILFINTNVLFGNSIPPPTGNSTQIYCEAESLTLNDAAVFNTNGFTELFWYTNATQTGSPISNATVVYDGAIYWVFQAIDPTAVGLEVSFAVETDIPAPNGDPVQSYCEVGGDFAIADTAIFNTTGFNGIYWFADANQSGSPLNNTTIINDGDVYWAFQGIGSCAMGLEISFEIIPHIPAPTGDENPLLCDNVVWTLNDLQVFNTSGYTSIFWFDEANQSTGNIIDPNTIVNDGDVYFAFQGIGCFPGYLEVHIHIQSFVPAPTGTSPQQFVAACNPILSDLAVFNTGTYTNIYWFDDAFQTTPLDSNTLLEDGEAYYAYQTIGNFCVGYLMVEIEFIAPIPAPTGESIQYFDEDDMITLSDLAVFNTGTFDGIFWFDSSDENANPIDPTTMVEDGMTYYAFQSGCTGCCADYLAVTTYLTLGVEESNQSFFELYPNPVTDILQIELKENNSQINLRISNLQGQKVFVMEMQPQTNSLRLDMKDFSAGIYIVQIKVDIGTQIQKIIVQ